MANNVFGCMVRFSLAALLAVLVAASRPAEAQISVSLSPTQSSELFANNQAVFTATVTNDVNHDGVTWKVSGGGSLTNKSTTAATYNAPGTVSGLTYVTLTATSVADTSETATAAITLNQPLAKAEVNGLVSQGAWNFTWLGGNPDNTMGDLTGHPNSYDEAVINVLWSQLYDANGDFDSSAIDGTGAYASPLQGLAYLANYNKTATLPVRAKIRVYVFYGEPPFALNNGGDPGGASVTDTVNGNELKTGAYWAKGFGTNWASLQTSLAALYDTDSLVAEVGMGQCSSADDEPFIELTDATDVNTFETAFPSANPAYSDAARMQCFTNAASPSASAYTVWKNTFIDWPFNTFANTTTCGNSCPTYNTQFALTTMDSFRATFGVHAIVGNHNLQDPLPNGLLKEYPEFRVLGGPVELQTVAVGQTAQDLCDDLEVGLQYDITEMELHQTKTAGGGGNVVIDTAQLGQLSQILKTRNTSYVCSNINNF